MKRILLAALAAVTLLGLASCDLFNSKSSGSSTTTPKVTYSTWWIKGSFDNWTQNGTGDTAATGASTHFFVVDSVNPNILTYSISLPSPGLRAIKYGFVVMGPDPAATRIKWNYVYPTGGITQFADNTAYTLVNSTTTGSADAGFTATSSTYTVQVDITTPTAPKVTLIPGTAVATAYSELEVANMLKLKGNSFDGSWNERTTVSKILNNPDAVYSASGHTVTWDNLVITNKSGQFGVQSAESWMTVPNVVASTVAPVSAVMVPGGTNPTFTGTPTNFPDTAYTFVVTIDMTKTAATGRYSLSVAVKTLGTLSWPPAIVTTQSTTAWSATPAGGAATGAPAPTSKLGTIQYSATAVANYLLVKVNFATLGTTSKNLWLFLGNANSSNAALPVTGDLGAGYGNLNIATNTVGFKADLAFSGWGTGVASGWNQGNVNLLSVTGTTITATDKAAFVSTAVDAAGSVWYEIPISLLGVTTLGANNVKALALWDTPANTSIPALTYPIGGTSTAAAGDISAVATLTF